MSSKIEEDSLKEKVLIKNLFKASNEESKNKEQFLENLSKNIGYFSAFMRNYPDSKDFSDEELSIIKGHFTDLKNSKIINSLKIENNSFWSYLILSFVDFLRISNPNIPIEMDQLNYYIKILIEWILLFDLNESKKENRSILYYLLHQLGKYGILNLAMDTEYQDKIVDVVIKINSFLDLKPFKEQELADFIDIISQLINEYVQIPKKMIKFLCQKLCENAEEFEKFENENKSDNQSEEYIKNIRIKEQKLLVIKNIIKNIQPLLQSNIRSFINDTSNSKFLSEINFAKLLENLSMISNEYILTFLSENNADNINFNKKINNSSLYEILSLLFSHEKSYELCNNYANLSMKFFSSLNEKKEKFSHKFFVFKALVNLMQYNVNNNNFKGYYNDLRSDLEIFMRSFLKPEEIKQCLNYIYSNLNIAAVNKNTTTNTPNFSLKNSSILSLSLFYLLQSKSLESRKISCDFLFLVIKEKIINNFSLIQFQDSDKVEQIVNFSAPFSALVLEMVLGDRNKDNFSKINKGSNDGKRNSANNEENNNNKEEDKKNNNEVDEEGNVKMKDEDEEENGLDIDKLCLTFHSHVKSLLNESENKQSVIVDLLVLYVLSSYYDDRSFSKLTNFFKKFLIESKEDNLKISVKFSEKDIKELIDFINIYDVFVDEANNPNSIHILNGMLSILVLYLNYIHFKKEETENDDNSDNKIIVKMLDNIVHLTRNIQITDNLLYYKNLYKMAEILSYIQLYDKSNLMENDVKERIQLFLIDDLANIMLNNNNKLDTKYYAYVLYKLNEIELIQYEQLKIEQVIVPKNIVPFLDDVNYSYRTICFVNNFYNFDINNKFSFIFFDTSITDKILDMGEILEKNISTLHNKYKKILTKSAKSIKSIKKKNENEIKKIKNDLLFNIKFKFEVLKFEAILYLFDDSVDKQKENIMKYLENIFRNLNNEILKLKREEENEFSERNGSETDELYSEVDEQTTNADLINFKIEKYLELIFSLISLKYPFTHQNFLQLSNLILVKSQNFRRKFLQSIANLTFSKRFSVAYYIPFVAAICLTLGMRGERGEKEEIKMAEKKNLEIGKNIVESYIKNVTKKLSKHTDDPDKYYKYIPELIIIYLAAIIIYNPNLNLMFQLSQDPKFNREKKFFNRIFINLFKMMTKICEFDSDFLVNLLINMNKENLNEINKELMNKINSFKDDFILNDDNIVYNLSLKENQRNLKVSFDLVKNNLVLQLLQILNGDFNSNFKRKIKEYRLPSFVFMQNQINGLYVIKKYYDEEDESDDDNQDDGDNKNINDEKENENVNDNNMQNKVFNESKTDDASGLEMSNLRNNDNSNKNIMEDKQNANDDDISSSLL